MKLAENIVSEGEQLFVPNCLKEEHLRYINNAVPANCAISTRFDPIFYS